MQSLYPEEYRLRDENKYYYRYPCGESYEDVAQRIHPVLTEYSASLDTNENRNPLFICSHQATIRCVLAHFLKVSPGTFYISVVLLELHYTIFFTVTAKQMDAWHAYIVFNL